MDLISKSTPLRILLVEDSEHDRVAFRRSFKKSQVPCEITECEHAEAALGLIKSDASQFDIMVADYKLPGITGLDLCKGLLAEETPFPLVILTGTGSEKLAVEALKAGVNDYIIKDPSQCYFELLPVVLREVVRKHVDRLACKRTEQALRESEEQLHSLIQNIQAAVVVHGPDTKIIKCNKASQNLLGLTEDQLLGKKAIDPLWRFFNGNVSLIIYSIISIK